MKNFWILLVMLAFAACANGSKSEPPKEDPPPKPEIKTENLICPQVAILKEAEEVFDYGGEKPEAAQLVAKVRMKNIDGDCAYRKGDIKKSGIDIAFTLESVAARGPRLGGSQVSFPYFIAVIDPSDNILSREFMTAQFNFRGGDKVTEKSESLHVFIPMPEAALTAGPDYRVIVGFKR